MHGVLVSFGELMDPLAAVVASRNLFIRFQCFNKLAVKNLATVF